MTTLSFTLPESMRAFIDARVRDGSYGSTSEYLRDLVRRDKEARHTEQLRAEIAAGLESGDGRNATDEVLAELRERSLSPLE